MRHIGRYRAIPANRLVENATSFTNAAITHQYNENSPAEAHAVGEINPLCLRFLEDGVGVGVRHE